MNSDRHPSPHRHLSEEEIFARVSEGDALPEIAGCVACESEAASLASFFETLKQADRGLVETNDWNDMLLRGRIRAAIAQEAPHRPSFFERFSMLRPVFASLALASLVLVVWSPWNTAILRDTAGLSAVTSSAHVPAWTPLPDEFDDEGFAILAEWTPSEEELAVARCRASCLAGLSAHEEESLLNDVATAMARTPFQASSPR